MVEWVMVRWGGAGRGVVGRRRREREGGAERGGVERGPSGVGVVVRGAAEPSTTNPGWPRRRVSAHSAGSSCESSPPASSPD